MSVGIVSGLAGTEYAVDCRQGLLDALSDTSCEIAYDIGVTHGMSITEELRQQKPVDYLIVLDTNALEQAAAMYAGKEGTGTKLYGIGNSMKLLKLLTAHGLHILLHVSLGLRCSFRYSYEVTNRLLDGCRRYAVLLIIFFLNLPTSLRLIDGPTHGIRHNVRIHYDTSVCITCSSSDCLNK